MSADTTAISVRNLYKSFKLPHEKQSSIKGELINFKKKHKGFEKHKVLEDINFEVKKGDFFGIVGKNGSGKSTLLKLLAGIYTPGRGSITLNGSLTPFIELGVGFNPELTGRENVFLNGALLGFNRREMLSMYDDIVDFAELERFMDQKLKNYSSGMQVRLAFSIAIKSNSSILLFDEVLAVGDTEFQQKCFNYFRKMKNESEKTIVLVTHDMSAIQKFCNRALVLDEGKVTFIGEPNEAAVIYQSINFPDKSSSKETVNQKVRIKVLNKRKNNVYSHGDKLEIVVEWDDDLVGVKNAGVALLSNEGVYIYGTNTIIDNIKLDTNSNRIEYTLELNLGGGIYSVKAAVFGETGDDTIFFNDIGITIQMKDEKTWGGISMLDHNWSKVD